MTPKELNAIEQRAASCLGRLSRGHLARMGRLCTTDVPALIAEVRRLQAENAVLRGCVEAARGEFVEGPDVEADLKEFTD